MSVLHIRMKDLQCYKNAEEKIKNHPRMCPDRCFDLGKLPPTKIRDEIMEFILERGKQLSPFSIIPEFYPFNEMCRFISECYPDIGSFKEIEKDEMIKKCKAYLLKQGKNLTQKRYRSEYGKTVMIDVDVIIYIKKIYSYFSDKPITFNYDSDIWILNDIPVNLRINPTKRMNTLNFSRISQKSIKEEAKKAIYFHLSQKALGSVAAEITTINRFSLFLKTRYPDIESLYDIDRELIEGYLIYLHTEVDTLKSSNKDLYRLKALLVTVGKIFEWKHLETLFYPDDFEKTPECLPENYSDAEVTRINEAIAEGDEQVARVLMLHQLLGTRISDLLTLRQDCIEGDVITIDQVKKRKSYTKIINEDIKKLIKRGIQYTCEKYGERKYIFVDKNNPDLPMQYSRVQYHLMKIIVEKDLRDDKGERFKASTHIFRHVYGKKLTEMGVDDITIARLLGHANTRSVHYYRKISNKVMADQTRDVRQQMDVMISKTRKGW